MGARISGASPLSSRTKRPGLLCTERMEGSATSCALLRAIAPVRSNVSCAVIGTTPMSRVKAVTEEQTNPSM
uniref:Uncharacterized protein n=1 Tax=Coccidioides posadasii RMSCC 3488 TaxID=454284 RepID=A0A0J6FP84_COCPO|nr:hypothetical protein CPAG_07100 [Coccidioides posadasii RMSCC 3488]